MKSHEIITEAGTWDAIKKGAASFVVGAGLDDKYDNFAKIAKGGKDTDAELIRKLTEILSDIFEKIKQGVAQGGNRKRTAAQMTAQMNSVLESLGIDINNRQIAADKAVIDRSIADIEYDDNRTPDSQVYSAIRRIAQFVVTQQKGKQPSATDSSEQPVAVTLTKTSNFRGMHLQDNDEDVLYFPRKNGWVSFKRAKGSSDRFIRDDLPLTAQQAIENGSKKHPHLMKQISIDIYSDNSINIAE
jgi:hypothetical protein